MKRSSALILTFAIAFAVFLIGPPLLVNPFGPYPLMEVADVFDILTPLALLPLYWLLYRAGRKEPDKFSGIAVFFVLAAFWVEGQGMHLSANSIGHLLKGMETSDVYRLTYFYDEVLSHYLWHFGIVGLSAAVVYRQWRSDYTEERARLWPPIAAGVIHGVTLFLIVIEGGTAPLGVTFAALVVLSALIRGRERIGRQPVLAFFFTSYAVATLLFMGWGIYWRGFPQLSEVGVI